MRILVVVLLLAGCSDVLGTAVGALLPSAPGVSANVQAGRTNTQTLGATNMDEVVLRDVAADHVEQNVGDVKVRSDKVDQIVINEAPWPLIVALVIGWLMPDPVTIYKWVVGMLRSRKTR